MTRPNDLARPDIYARITNQIIAQLEAGVRPWTQPWISDGSICRPLRHDGVPYSGIISFCFGLRPQIEGSPARPG